MKSKSSVLWILKQFLLFLRRMFVSVNYDDTKIEKMTQNDGKNSLFLK